MALHNRINKQVLKERLQEDNTPRVTLSFYRYVHIADPAQWRDELYKSWEEMGCLGRIYIAREGINAQMAVPAEKWKEFQDYIADSPFLKGVPLKIAVEDNGKSFYKLKIKVRPKIVADGLNDSTFDVTNCGRHLTAEEFNEAIESGAIVVDMRNHYESEVGHFEGAIMPDADTFRDELKMVKSLLQGKENEKILMYCTGGIRCEKASAYMKHLGFKDVNQLQGGIIEYAHQIKEKNLENKFIGKNFVFDERLGERITTDVIATCHQCGTTCDAHTNCANDDCHLLFIQCEACKEKFNACCSDDCMEFIALPIEQQRVLRRGQKKADARNIFKKGRLRPRLAQPQ